jgi:hypothetical protein
MQSVYTVLKYQQMTHISSGCDGALSKLLWNFPLVFASIFTAYIAPSINVCAVYMYYTVYELYV